MKKGTLTIMTLTITVCCFIFQLYIAHKLSTAGIELSRMEQEISRLSLENEELRHSIASHSSLLSIAQRAEVYGFAPASFYTIEKPPIALVQ